MIGNRLKSHAEILVVKLVCIRITRARVALLIHFVLSEFRHVVGHSGNLVSPTPKNQQIMSDDSEEEIIYNPFEAFLNVGRHLLFRKEYKKALIYLDRVCPVTGFT